MTEEKYHPHDKGYKFLLSSQEVFLQLLQCFIDKDWVKNIDKESITPIDKSFVLKDFTEKEADLVYRLKIQDQEVIFYILMELQSSVDFQMPYRLLTYMTGIWQEIGKNISKEELKRKDFHFPVIIPIVLYNGKRNWTVPLSFKESLVGYQLFEDYVLDFKYFLLDVKRYQEEELLELANLIGSVFLVDQKKRDIGEIFLILKKLLNTVNHLPHNHARLFMQWLQHIIIPILPKGMAQKVQEEIAKAKPEEVEKMISNLGKSIEDALAQAKLQGRQEGEKRGEKRGRLEALKEIVVNMLSNGIPAEDIARTTGIPLEQIEEIKSKM